MKYIRWTISGSLIIVMLMQMVMSSERFPVLTRLITINLSLSLTIMLGASNCMETTGAGVAVGGQVKCYQIKPCYRTF